MNRYLFFVAQLYSYAILRPLQDAIRARGDEAAWFLYNVEDRLTADDAPRLTEVSDVLQFNPRAVFVPTNWVPHFFPGVKVEVFHGFNIGKRANSRQDHFRIRGQFDLYCTQGPDTTAPFQALAQKHGFFHVAETGWPKLDPLFTADDRDALRRELGTDKPVVMFASTFSPSFTAAPLLAESIKRLAASGRWHWIVTLHPKMDKSVVDTYRAMVGPNLSFFESGNELTPLLHCADAMLCDTSSILLEFLLLNKPVVTFNTATPGPHLIDIHQLGDVEGALETALSRPAELMAAVQSYGNQVHPSRDSKSSQRVLEAADFFADELAGTLKPKPFNLGRKLQARKRLSYYGL